MCRTPNPWEAQCSNETYHYKGQEFTLTDTKYSVCRECGFDVVLPRQKRQNDARIRDEHRRISGLLTGPQIRDIRKRLGLSQIEAARLMGGGVNAFSKYERGEVTQSIAMNHLLRVLDAQPDALSVFASRKNSISSVRCKQVLQITIHVAEGITERPIYKPRVKTMNVERARNYDPELLAA